MILICGYGGDSRRVDEMNAKKRILQICKNKTVAIITNAKPDNNIETMVEVSKFLSKNKIQNKLFNLNNQDLSWQKYDCIYFGGGSPYKLMCAISQNGFTEFEWKTKIIIGQSAGGMILFNKFCDEINNEFFIFDGLGIIQDEKVLTPHFNSLNEEYKTLYLKCLSKNNIETIELNDKEFLEF